MVEENYLQKQEKVEYCSVNATAHYSFDWAQDVQVPHFSQQPSQMYFLTAHKVHLFGIQNEATREQINYVLNEDEVTSKDPNGTLSLVFNGIKQFNRGEKYLKLTCDNAVGQNKNNNTIQFCQFLVMTGYYESIELNFMIAGHTKFSPDRNFGMIKKLYQKSTTYNTEQFIEVVRKSSPAGLNKVQSYEKGKGFQYFDFKGTLEKYFVKLPKIGKYHHFRFSADKLGVVKVQEFANGSFTEFNLLKNDDKRVVEEISNLNFSILTPIPLSHQRQEYLCQKVYPLIPEKYQDVAFFKPRQNTGSKYLLSVLKNSEMEAEVKFTSDRELGSFSSVVLVSNSFITP